MRTALVKGTRIVETSVVIAFVAGTNNSRSHCKINPPSVSGSSKNNRCQWQHWSSRCKGDVSYNGQQEECQAERPDRQGSAVMVNRIQCFQGWDKWVTNWGMLDSSDQKESKTWWAKEMLVSTINDLSPSFHISVVLIPEAHHLKGRVASATPSKYIQYAFLQFFSN